MPRNVQVLFFVAVVFMSLLGLIVHAVIHRSYHRHIANWARDHNWVFRPGRKNLAWRYRLPHGANKGVRFQVDGIMAERRFTLGYVNHEWRRETETRLSEDVHLTVIVFHLRNNYPSVEVTRRSGWAGAAGRAFGTIGHPGFDESFVVHTEVPGGPRAVVPHALAEAHVQDEVPVWAVRDRELVCLVSGGPPARVRNERLAGTMRSLGVRTLDQELARALRVADLLGVR